MNTNEQVFLKAEGVGLDLPLFTQEKRSVTQSAGVLLRAAFEPPMRQVRTILDEIGFELRKGDRLAVVGRNGSGKSTLLKVLVGAYQPTRGRVMSNGSRQALLNLSLGFNPEGTTGRRRSPRSTPPRRRRRRRAPAQGRRRTPSTRCWNFRI